MSTILIVEDIDGMRNQYAYDIHRKTGYEVMTASNGCEALDILSHHHIDLMILDLGMPVMGGMEVLKRLSPQKQHQIIIIIYTAKGDFHRHTEAAKFGANYFMNKHNISMDKLVEVIEHELKN